MDRGGERGGPLVRRAAARCTAVPGSCWPLALAPGMRLQEASPALACTGYLSEHLLLPACQLVDNDFADYGLGAHPHQPLLGFTQFAKITAMPTTVTCPPDSLCGSPRCD